MSDLQYHVANAVSKQDKYVEFNNIDFDLNVGEGRSLVKNSVRLLGDLKVLDNNAANTAEIYFDHVVGAHAFIDSVQVTFTEGKNAGLKENLQNYARYVAMVENATSVPEDAFNAGRVCELKGVDTKVSKLFANGRTTRNSGAKLTADQDFSLKPVCVLNKMSGGNLSFDKSGQIRLSVNLAQNASALMGSDLNSAQDTYEIRNPRVVYQSILTQPKEQPTIMRSVYNVKNTIQSNLANISAKVPVVSDSLSISWQKQNKENTAPFSNYQLEMPKGLNELQIMFNDSTNEYITYAITDLTEMLQKGVDSIIDNGHNMVSGSRFGSNQNFIAGLAFNGYVDLSTQKINVQIRSGADNANAYNVYMYFHSIMSL